MRFKKQIVIICLFTFLFLPFQLNKKEITPNAEILTMSYFTFEAISALLLASGIVFTDNLTHRATVYETYDKMLEYKNGDITEDEYFNSMVESVLGNTSIDVNIPVADKIKDVVKEVYELTYSDVVDNKRYTSLKEIIPSNTEVGVLPSANVGDTFNLYLKNGQQFRLCGYNHVWSGVDGVVTFKVTGVWTSNYIELQWGEQSATYDYKYGTPVLFSSAIATLADYLFSPDWTNYREQNADIDINASVGALAGSICADKTLTDELEKEFDNSKLYDYPLTSEQLGVTYEPTKDDVIDTPIDKPQVDETDTPITGDSLWDTLFGWLKTLISPITKLLSSLWDLLKGLFDLLKGLLTSILDLLKSLVKSLVDAIAALFVPTLALEDVFNLNQNTFFGQIAQVFDFDNLWNVTPKPFEFVTDIPFYDFFSDESKPYRLEIKFFENKFIKENIKLIRNITTYPLLLVTIYFIVMHFIPKREMD